MARSGAGASSSDGTPAASRPGGSRSCGWTPQEVHLDAGLRAGHHREVLGEAQARVAEAPLRERRWALLALAQYQAGRQGDALRTLHQARRVLAERAGRRARPGPGRLGAGDPASGPVAGGRGGAARARAQCCPYLGLVPYDVDDADGFFGRDGEVGRLPAPAGRGRACSWSSGPSGSGKSSLVRAGVAAALRRDGRSCRGHHARRPGRWTRLTALPASGPAPVLVVDQCEEVVTLCDDPAERALLRRPGGARRTRSVGHRAARRPARRAVALTPSFARLVEPGLHLLSAMSDADLRAAIEGPGPPGRPAARTRPGRPAGTRGRGRARRAAAAVARAARDVAAAGGPHPHRRRATSAPVGSEVRSPSPPRRSTRRSPTSSGRCCATCCLRLVTPDPREGAGAQPGPASHRRHRCRARTADRAPRRGPAGDERRRHRSSWPTSPSPGPGPVCGLARRRRRGPAHPAPPDAGRRRLGRHGPARQRAVPRRPADQCACLAERSSPASASPSARSSTPVARWPRRSNERPRTGLGTSSESTIASVSWSGAWPCCSWSP